MYNAITDYYFVSWPDILTNRMLTTPQRNAYLSVYEYFTGKEQTEAAIVVMPTIEYKQHVLALAPYYIAAGRVLLLTDDPAPFLPTNPHNIWLRQQLFTDEQQLPSVVTFTTATTMEEVERSVFTICSPALIDVLYERVGATCFTMLLLDGTITAPYELFVAPMTLQCMTSTDEAIKGHVLLTTPASIALFEGCSLLEASATERAIHELMLALKALERDEERLFMNYYFNEEGNVFAEARDGMVTRDATVPLYRGFSPTEETFAQLRHWRPFLERIGQHEHVSDLYAARKAALTDYPDLIGPRKLEYELFLGHYLLELVRFYYTALLLHRHQLTIDGNELQRLPWRLCEEVVSHMSNDVLIAVAILSEWQWKFGAFHSGKWTIAVCRQAEQFLVDEFLPQLDEQIKCSRH